MNELGITGVCDKCGNNNICKQIEEVKQVESELLEVINKHKDLTSIRVGRGCDKFIEYVPPTQGV